MATNRTDRERKEVEACVVDSILFAERMAERLAPFLMYAGIQTGLSADTLLRLAACLQVREWERTGLTSHPGLSKFSASEIADQFVGEVRDQQVNPEAGKRLWIAVSLAWRFHCARAASRHLGVDVLLGPTDHDSAAEAMAQFLWQFRTLANQ